MPEPVLKENDLEAIKANLADLDEAENQIRLAEQAGIDVSTFKAQLRDQRQQLNRIRSAYFPGQ